MASVRVPRNVHRRGERPEAGKGNGRETAKGNRHAERQADGRGAIKVPVGAGKQVNTVRRQSGQAGKHARDLNTKKVHSVSAAKSRDEAVQTSKSRALGVVSAVAPLLALGVDVHPS